MKGPPRNSRPAKRRPHQDHRNHGVTGRPQPYFQPGTGAPTGSQRLIDSFIALDVHDVRFPTSDELDGSDAMNPSPDYSAAYAVLRTDSADGLEGHALAFTTGPATTYRSGPSKG